MDAAELSNIAMTTGGEKKYDTVIDRGRLKEWVDIGWVDLGPATDKDRRKHPEVRR